MSALAANNDKIAVKYEVLHIIQFSDRNLYSFIVVLILGFYSATKVSLVLFHKNSEDINSMKKYFLILGFIREPLIVVRNFIRLLQERRALLALSHQPVKKNMLGSVGDKFEEWSTSEGFIERSKRFDSRNTSDCLNYTSIILDASKPVSRND